LKGVEKLKRAFGSKGVGILGEVFEGGDEVR
jgi:hypothetical protein